MHKKGRNNFHKINFSTFCLLPKRFVESYLVENMSIIKQGEKLMLLVKRDSRMTEEIATAMNIDKSYLPRLYKMDVLPPKPFQKALEVFGVSAAYFLEGHPAPMIMTEPDSPYHNKALEKLQTEMNDLRDELSRLTKMLEQEKAINANLAEALKNLSKRE